MCLNRLKQQATLKQQTGFSMPVAVFILVIMALLAAAIVQLASRSNFSATQEELSNRAFYAAESGASMGLSQLFFNSAGVADITFSNNACAAINSPNLSAAPGLATCSVVVTCSSEILDGIGYYTITSTGTCGTFPIQGVRQIEVGAKNGG